MVPEERSPQERRACWELGTCVTWNLIDEEEVVLRLARESQIQYYRKAIGSMPQGPAREPLRPLVWTVAAHKSQLSVAQSMVLSGSQLPACISNWSINKITSWWDSEDYNNGLNGCIKNFECIYCLMYYAVASYTQNLFFPFCFHQKGHKIETLPQVLSYMHTIYK